MAAVYYNNKPFDLYNQGNDYQVTGYGYASAQIMSAVKEHGTKGQLDYYVEQWSWVADEKACPDGRFAVNSGLYDNVSGTELPFLFPSGTYASESGKFTFPEEIAGEDVTVIYGDRPESEEESEDEGDEEVTEGEGDEEVTEGEITA